jgi:hypothetical protein
MPLGARMPGEGWRSGPFLGEVTIFWLSCHVIVSRNLNRRGGQAEHCIVSLVRAPRPVGAYINHPRPGEPCALVRPSVTNWSLRLFAVHSGLGVIILLAGLILFRFFVYSILLSRPCCFSVLLYLYLYFFLFVGFRMEFAWIDVK